MPTKLSLDFFEEEKFSLVAINTALPLYRLLFIINKQLEVSFKRLDKDLDFQYKNGQANYAIYSYFSHDYKAKAYIIANKAKLQSFHTLSTGTLFNGASTQSFTYLLPELKAVDYLLKIEQENELINLKTILSQLKSLDQIATAFQVNQEKIKHPENLIVE